jgi:hypothetical protein
MRSVIVLLGDDNHFPDTTVVFVLSTFGNAISQSRAELNVR